MAVYYLQNRWVVEKNKLTYYGLRNKEDMFKNTVKLNKQQLKIVTSLPRELSAKEIKRLKKLIGVQIVEGKALNKTPDSLDEARFCKTCVANDYMIPGLEFDSEGKCPMCQTAQQFTELRSILPVMTDVPRSDKSRFDIAVFYTGGKDSTYLLYYLSKVKNLRVLALTWEIPYMSELAKKSIANAKKCFTNVEFISRSVSAEDLKVIYNKLYELSENTCACPSLAYLLFYPEMVANKVPYFVAGNEPVQMLGLYYNHMAPKLAYKISQTNLLTAITNIGRVLTLHPPLHKGQIYTLLTMKQLAYGEKVIQKLAGYSNPLVLNAVKAIHEVPMMLGPLKKSIRASSWSGNVPAFIHIDLDEACGGHYDWKKIRDVLVDECGWVAPDSNDKNLHTSCKIERCKDHSQFNRFRNCKTTMIPFSAIEISLASRNCGRTREESIKEIEESLGFTIDEIPECAIMRGYIEK